ncbi:hypothetical protein ACFQX6_63010 [Streptosporangium lutulentum]
MLFGRAQQGLKIDPFSFMRTVWRELTGLGYRAEPSLGLGAGDHHDLPAVLGRHVVRSLRAALLPRLLLRPAVILMLGIGAAGLGAMLLFGHPSRSQLFFLWGAYPYLAAVTVYGLLVLRRQARISLKATICWAA